jgi:hypothetical protein
LPSPFWLPAGKLVYKITNLGLDVFSGPGAVITFDLKKDR